jgi:hypothetical protein
MVRTRTNESDDSIDNLSNEIAESVLESSLSPITTKPRKTSNSSDSSSVDSSGLDLIPIVRMSSLNLDMSARKLSRKPSLKDRHPSLGNIFDKSSTSTVALDEAAMAALLMADYGIQSGREESSSSPKLPLMMAHKGVDSCEFEEEDMYSPVSRIASIRTLTNVGHE